MVRIGIIGIGFMGYTHFTGASKLRGGKVTAIVTRSKKKLAGDWRGIQGNFGPPAGKVDLKGVKTFSDYHELLADPDIDLVDICLPTDQHEQVTLDAIKAGKHVLVEKPIATDLKAADRMVRAANKAGVILMVGQVLPFFPEFRYVAEVIEKGKYGKLLAAHFRRVITPPKWSTDMADFRKLGGWGVEIFLEKATIAYDAGTYGKPPEWVVNRPLTLITNDGKARPPKLKGGSEWYAAFSAELQAAVDGVKSGSSPRVLSGELARDALKLCFAEAKSIATGRVVKV